MKSRNDLVRKRYRDNERAQNWLISLQKQRKENFNGYVTASGPIFFISDIQPRIATPNNPLTLIITLSMDLQPIFNPRVINLTTGLVYPLTVTSSTLNTYICENSVIPVSGNFAVYINDALGNVIKSTQEIICSVPSINNISPVNVFANSPFELSVEFSKDMFIQSAQLIPQFEPLIPIDLFSNYPLLISNLTFDVLAQGVKSNVYNLRVEDIGNNIITSSQTLMVNWQFIRVTPISSLFNQSFIIECELSDEVSAFTNAYLTNTSTNENVNLTISNIVSNIVTFNSVSLSEIGKYSLTLVSLAGFANTSVETISIVDYSILNFIPDSISRGNNFTVTATLSTNTKTIVGGVLVKSTYPYTQYLLNCSPQTSNSIIYGPTIINDYGLFYLHCFDSNNLVVVSPDVLTINFFGIVDSNPNEITAGVNFTPSALTNISVELTNNCYYELTTSPFTKYYLTGVPTGVLSSFTFGTMNIPITGSFKLVLEDTQNNLVSTDTAVLTTIPFVINGISNLLNEVTSPYQTQVSLNFSQTIVSGYWENVIDPLIRIDLNIPVGGVTGSNLVFSDITFTQLGTYKLTLVNNFDVLSTAQNNLSLNVVSFSIVSFTPLVATTNINYTPTITLSQSTTIQSGKLTSVSNPLSFVTLSGFPQTGSSIIPQPISINTPGDYILSLRDNLNVDVSSSLILTVNPYYIVNYSTSPVIKNELFNLTATLNVNTIVITQGYFVLNANPLVVFNLSNINHPALSSTLTAECIITQEGVYTLFLVSSLGYTVAASGVTVCLPFSITGFTPLNVEKSILFTPTASISIASSIDNAYWQNVSTNAQIPIPANYPLNSNTNFTFNSMSISDSGTYTLVLATSQYTVFSIDTLQIDPFSLTINSPASVAAGTDFQINYSLSSAPHTLTDGRLVLTQAPFTTIPIAYVYPFTYLGILPFADTLIMSINTGGLYNVQFQSEGLWVTAAETLFVVRPEVVSISPLSVVAGTLFDPIIMMNIVATIYYAGYENVFDSNDSYAFTGYPQTFVSLNSSTQVSINNIGTYRVRIDDIIGSIYSNSPNIIEAVPFTITSFTPNTPIDTGVTFIPTAVISNGVTVTSANWINVSTLEVIPISLASGVLTGPNITFTEGSNIETAGTYQLQLTNIATTVTSIQTLTINDFSILDNTPTFTSINTNFQPSATLSSSRTIINALYRNLNVPFNTYFLQPIGTLTGSNLTWSNTNQITDPGIYRLELTDSIPSTAYGPNNLTIASFTITSIDTPTNPVLNIPTSVTITLSAPTSNGISSAAWVDASLNVYPITLDSQPIGVGQSTITLSSSYTFTQVGVYFIRVTEQSTGYIVQSSVTVICVDQLEYPNIDAYRSLSNSFFPSYTLSVPANNQFSRRSQQLLTIPYRLSFKFTRTGGTFSPLIIGIYNNNTDDGNNVIDFNSCVAFVADNNTLAIQSVSSSGNILYNAGLLSANSGVGYYLEISEYTLNVITIRIESALGSGVATLITSNLPQVNNALAGSTNRYFGFSGDNDTGSQVQNEITMLPLLP